MEGRLAAKVIRRGKKAIAILDAFPLALGHTLIISGSHVGKVQDLEGDEAADLFALATKVVAAVEKAGGAPSSLVAIHNGREAGQEIAHVHIHIIPRSPSDGAGPVHSMFRHRPESAGLDMDSVYDQIRAELQKREPGN